MNYKQFFKNIGLTLFFIIPIVFPVLSQQKAKIKPNVLLIMVDDMNDWVGCLGGHPNAFTPNIDKLASNGVLFTNAHCAAPVCNPSRTSMLTGMAPYTTGVYMNDDQWVMAGTLKNIVPLPLLFKHNGYYTMTVGKIFHSKPDNWKQFYYETGGGFGGQNFHLISREYTYPFSKIDGVHNFAFHWGPIDYPEAEQLSDPKIADWATERLKRDYDKPFFLSVGFHRPHTPLISPRKYFERFKNEELVLPVINESDLEDIPLLGKQIATAGYQEMQNGTYEQVKKRNVHKEIVESYLAACTFVDEQIGKVLNALENSKYSENTIVVFVSDHGWSLGEQTHFKKWALWENTTHVPMIIQCPGMTSNGKHTNAGVTLLDIYPTLVDMCGLPMPDHKLDGESVKPLLLNIDYNWERPAITTYGQNNYAIRSSRWRYIHYTDNTKELYDHTNDNQEWYNLANVPRMEKVIQPLSKWLPKNGLPAVNSDHSLPVRLTSQEDTKCFRMISDKFIGKPIHIQAKLGSEFREGEIVSLRSQFAGFSLYIEKKTLCFEIMDVPSPLNWNNLYPSNLVIKSSENLSDGSLQVEAKMDIYGNVELWSNGKKIGKGIGKTLSIHPAGIMHIGDTGPNKIEEVIVNNK